MLKFDQIVHARSPDLIPTHRRVLEFILRKPAPVAFLTPNHPARQPGLSDTTVIWTARVPGYAGYHHLKRLLKEYLRGTIAALHLLAGRVLRQESLGGLLGEVYSRDVNNLRTTLEQTDPVDFKRFVHEMLQAWRHFFIALRPACFPVVLMSSALWALGELERLSRWKSVY